MESEEKKPRLSILKAEKKKKKKTVTVVKER